MIVVRIEMKKRKSQIWSLDSMISIGIFLSAIILFFTLFYRGCSIDYSGQLISEAENLQALLASPPEMGGIGLVDGVFVDDELLLYLHDNTVKPEGIGESFYNSLREKWGIEQDFFVYFENKDGFIVPLGQYESAFFGSPVIEKLIADKED